MILDEVERLAREIAAYDAWSEDCAHDPGNETPPPHMPRLAEVGGKYDDAASHLARAVLAMADVVKVAERVVSRGIHRRHGYRDVLLREVMLLPNDIEILAKLAESIATLREGMK